MRSQHSGFWRFTPIHGSLPPTSGQHGAELADPSICLENRTSPGNQKTHEALPNQSLLTLSLSGIIFMNTILSSAHRSAHITFSILLLGCLAATPALAETRYIKPSMDVAIRQEQVYSSKTVANVPIGTPVELVKGDKEWSFVRLPNAAEGWVRSRFLSSSPIQPVSNLKGGTESAPPVDTPTRIKELNDENNRLRKEFAACTTDRSTLADKYQTLVGDPNSVLHTKTSLGEAQQQIEELQDKLATAQIENTVLKKNESIKWFLAGSSVLLLGWLIGRLTSSARKKRPSLI